MGIKLGRIKGPTGKKEAESSKKTNARTSSSGSKKGKESSVNAVNPGRQGTPQYSLNFAPALSVTQAYAPPPIHYQQQSYSTLSSPISQPIFHNYTPASHQTRQNRPPPPRPYQPGQQASSSQGQQGGASQPRQREQFTTLPAPLSHIYRQLLAGSRIIQEAPSRYFNPANQDQSKHCEFHMGAPGHTTDDCWKLREKIQEMIKKRQLSFNASKPPNVQVNPLLDHGSSLRPTINMISVCALGEEENKKKTPTPFVIVYVSEETTVGFTGSSVSLAIVVIDVPAKEPYQDNRVPWMYESCIDNLEQQMSVMEVPKETAPGQIEETINTIFSNTTSFSNDELHFEGYGLSRALHIVCKCNNFIVGRVMIDNGSTLNMCPVSTLKQMNVDFNRIQPSKTAVRRFDGSRRDVNGEIDLPIYVGPCSFAVTFQVLDIPNAFNLLLRRPWIHSAGVVPSSLHQKLKFIVEGKLITVKG
ncbi:hypothetical protein CRG98_027009 [Punica granatum]|uniref:Retrotransposon gag domain-containing protein n=1 Tax=Punica granatum TaxID=22663 RepID=A0A2I0J8K5_PUNGR|nr:hypothetical protein CRG98_027009 [Punica granatum]